VVSWCSRRAPAAAVQRQLAYRTAAAAHQLMNATDAGTELTGLAVEGNAGAINASRCLRRNPGRTN